MARARGARSQIAAAFETIYGTAPVSGFLKMPYASSTLGQTQGLLDNELLGYGRDPLAPELDVVNVDGDHVVALDAEAFGVWLKGALGTPTTSGTGTYTHVFETGSWSLPSLTVETGLPDVPYYAAAKGVMVDRISIPMQRQGQQQATVSLRAQGEDIGTTTITGTPTAFELIRFGSRLGSITRGGTALGNVVSAEISYANNLDPVETIRADGKIDGLDPGMAALTGQMVVRFADQTLLNQAINGEASAFEFAWERPSGESLTISVPKLYLPRPKIEIPGPGGIQATFSWQAAQDDGGNPMATFTLVNSVESY